MGNPVRYSDSSGHCVGYACIEQTTIGNSSVGSSVSNPIGNSGSGGGGIVTISVLFGLAITARVAINAVQEAFGTYFPGRAPAMSPLPGYGQGEQYQPFGSTGGVPLITTQPLIFTNPAQQQVPLITTFPTESGVPPLVVLKSNPASQVLHVSELGLLPKAAPGTDTIVLGQYFLPGDIYDLPGLGPRDLSNQPYFLDTVLRPAASQLGGRTLVSFPGDIEVMQREIIKADRIVFFTRPDMRGLTMQEMEFIQSHRELRDKTIFIYGGLVEPFPRIK